MIKHLIKIANLIEYLNVNLKQPQLMHQPQLRLILGNQRQLFQQRLNLRNRSAHGSRNDTQIYTNSTIHLTVKKPITVI